MSYTPSADIKGLIPEYWTPFLQAPLYKSLVALETANTRFETYLKDGDTINHSYIAMPDVQDYTPYTEITEWGVVDAEKEQLVVNEVKVAPFVVDRIEELQANINMVAELGERAGYQLKDTIDTAVLEGVKDGTAFNFGSALTTDNIIQFFASAKRELREANVEEDGDWITIVTPAVAELIERVAADNGFQVADSTLKNGFAGNFLGLKVYISNNLPTTSDETSIYIGKRGMIDLVMQAAPQMDISKAENMLGYKFKPFTVFGTKVFHENAKRFLNATVSIGSSS